jgi:hypothetical protein
VSTIEEAKELAAKLITANPGKRFAIAENGNGIGIFSEAEQRFIAIVEKTIVGPWVWTEGMELLVNGARLERHWQEIPRV